MWAHLRCSYEIRKEAIYLAVVEEPQALRQLDSTIEELAGVVSTTRARERHLVFTSSFIGFVLTSRLFERNC